MEDNQMKMREALKELVGVIDECDINLPLWWHNGAKGVIPLLKARAALSAQPRQCDVVTAEEQTKRYDSFCNEHYWDDKDGGSCRECPLSERKNWSCQLAWAQMPYAEEGGAK